MKNNSFGVWDPWDLLSDLQPVCNYWEASNLGGLIPMLTSRELWKTVTWTVSQCSTELISVYETDDAWWGDKRPSMTSGRRKGFNLVLPEIAIRWFRLICIPEVSTVSLWQKEDKSPWNTANICADHYSGSTEHLNMHATQEEDSCLWFELNLQPTQRQTQTW